MATENVHKPYNLPAFIRICNTVGIGDVNCDSTDPKKTDIHLKAAGGSSHQVKLHFHDSIKVIYQILKKDFTILATHVGKNNIDQCSFYLTEPTAIIIGNELDRLTSETIENVDDKIAISTLGMI